MAEIKFCYECEKIELVPSQVFGSLENRKGTLTTIQKERPITYTPDFVGDGWYIETKGMVTPDFRIKWKLFKRYLSETAPSTLLFMPSNRKQVDLCVELLRNIGKKDTIQTARAKRAKKGIEGS